MNICDRPTLRSLVCVLASLAILAGLGGCGSLKARLGAGGEMPRIYGEVTNKEGAPIPGVKIKIRPYNPLGDGSPSFTGMTDPGGAYRCANLYEPATSFPVAFEPGSVYRIEFSRDGLQTFEGRFTYSGDLSGASAILSPVMYDVLDTTAPPPCLHPCRDSLGPGGVITDGS